ncbi:MAG: hypothetical protein GX594_12855 [Pirellulaceae bacterium]|nr:hypothetical protein [Pirellulaceae bacterium]
MCVCSHGEEAAPPIPQDISPELRELIKGTLSNNVNERAAAARELNEMGHAAIPAIPFLIRLLGDETEPVKGLSPHDYAFSALKSIGKPALQPLLDHLADCSVSSHRSEISYLLAYLKDRRVVEALINLLDDKEADVRRSAARGLRLIPDLRALEPLLAKACDSDAEVRAAVASALGSINGPEAVDALISLLGDADKEVRESAASALYDAPDSCALMPLLARLHDENCNVRAKAAITLGRLKDARAIEPLLKLLHCDTNYRVRKYSAYAIGEIGDVGAVEALLLVFKNDSEEDVRRAAVSALGDIGDSRAVEPIIMELQEGMKFNEPLLYLKCHAMTIALGNLKDPRSLNILTKVLLDYKGAPDLRVRIAAALALGKLSDGRVAEPLVAVWKDEKDFLMVRCAAALALGNTCDRQRIDALNFVVNRSAILPWSIQAIERLGEIEELRAKNLLREILNHSEGVLHMAASIAVQKQELQQKLADESDGKF